MPMTLKSEIVVFRVLKPRSESILLAVMEWLGLRVQNI